MVEAWRSSSHVCRLLYSASGRGAAELDNASRAAATPCGAAVFGQSGCCLQAQGRAQSTSDILKATTPPVRATRKLRSVVLVLVESCFRFLT